MLHVRAVQSDMIKTCVCKRVFRRYHGVCASLYKMLFFVLFHKYLLMLIKRVMLGFHDVFMLYNVDAEMKAKSPPYLFILWVKPLVVFWFKKCYNFALM